MDFDTQTAPANLRVRKHTRKRARITVAPRSLLVPAPEVVASKHLAVVLFRDFRVLCLLLFRPLMRY
jgi:hypothetical protein